MREMDISMMSSALARRYGGRGAKLVSGKRVRFTDDDGETFAGVIVEAIDAGGRRVVRVQLDVAGDAAESPAEPAPIVEVPAERVSAAAKNTRSRHG
jgi:hypothetical protein